jgi:DNA (cytosine-5)-methyltransferase 1
MKFGSVCSGIEAASVAWNPLGWKAAWLSEIEPFPCQVLKHHYPDVPNLGDMTTLPERIRSGEVEAPDLFCGGTPCQAFSVAGLRKSLDDARGNLSLTFCEIANAIDSVRPVRESCIVFWENVPGVLNTKDNAFGCFLAGLAGEADALVPPGGRWTNAGFIDGPQRAVAWRVLDAQYFGVAQRRRRVFVVASAREGFDPAAVLFEFEGLRRDTAPSREAGQRVTLTVTNGPPFSRTGNERVEADAMIAMGCGVEIISATGGGFVGSLCARDSKTVGSQFVDEGKVFAQPAYAIQGSMIGRNDNAGPQGDGINEEVCFTQNCADRHGVAYAVRTANTSANGHGVAQEVSHTLDRAQGQAVAFQQTADCLTAAYGTKWNGNASATNGSLFAAQVAAAVQATAVAIDTYNQTEQSTAHTIRAGAGMEGVPATYSAMQVRRLTPVECERLQGFPDGYTDIQPKGKPTPDGPRYKALGNSWAVPVVRWIGERIARAT